MRFRPDGIKVISRVGVMNGEEFSVTVELRHEGRLLLLELRSEGMVGRRILMYLAPHRRVRIVSVGVDWRVRSS